MDFCKLEDNCGVVSVQEVQSLQLHNMHAINHVWTLLPWENIPFIILAKRTGRQAPKHPGGFQRCHTRFSSALEMQNDRTLKNNAIWTWPAWLQHSSLTVNYFSNKLLTKSVNFRQFSFCGTQVLVLKNWSRTDIPAGFHRMIPRHAYQACEHNSLVRDTTLKMEETTKEASKRRSAIFF